MAPVVPVLLSGGSGTRLWPLSRSAAPKQLLPLLGERTMLQMTALRAADEALFAPPMLVTGAALAEESLRQLDAVGCGAASAILEPVGRNTAPALALAALASDPDAILLAMPSDHYIRDEDAFRSAVAAGLPLAAEDWLVAFGIEPTAPETGYGYIERGDALSAGAYRAARFVEKPDAQTARSMLASGRFLWNGGLFMFRAGAMTAALTEHAPEVLAAAEAALADGERDGAILRPSEAAFARSPGISIDYAVMEKARRIAMVPVSMGWSDVGSWDALAAVTAADEAGNAVSGDVILLDSSDCLIRSSGPMVAALGLSGLVVVATPDAVLVLPASRSQELKRVVDELKTRAHPTLDRHVAGAEDR